jgi:hypothetical protein
MKPTLFISHSSADKDYLLLLKEFLLEKLGGTIEIFLSSDGQSIPFGSNWVHSVESALDRASVMFVAVSPMSFYSTWVPFEAGYAYARKIQVVPIAILGARLEKVPPPLGLLQGFNVSSNEGLNNIIAVVNRQYKFTFQEDFTIEDYALLQSTGKGHLLENPWVNLIDYCKTHLYPSIKGDSEPYTLSKQSFDHAKKVLTQRGLPFVQDSETSIVARGMHISETTDNENKSLSIMIDPISVGESVHVLRELFVAAYEPTPKQYWLNVYFSQNVKSVVEGFKVSARLLGTSVTFSEWLRGGLKYKNVVFKMENEETFSLLDRSKNITPRLRIVGQIEDKESLPILDLIELLVKRGVLQETA